MAAPVRLQTDLNADSTKSAMVMTTRSGRPVLVREVLPTDVDRLVQLYQSLSPRTIRLRFLGPGMADLPLREAARLTNRVHRVHRALLALSFDRGHEGAALAVAELAPAHCSPGTAEIAALVTDRLQGEGLGSALLQRLVEEACMSGYSRIEADVSEENEVVRHLVNRSALPVRARVSAGSLQYTIYLNAERSPTY